MSIHLPFILHLLLGSLAVVCYWGALLARKGSLPHRRWGRAFFTLLLPVALSVGPLLVLKAGRVQADYIVQFSYLSLCLFTVGLVGWSAIRLKSDPERFRGWHFRLLGGLIFLGGMVVLGAGLAQGRLLPVVFSLIGLVFGGAMLRFAWQPGALPPRWWLGWHLNAVCLLVSAVHGTVLVVALRSWFNPPPGEWLPVLCHGGMLVVALLMRLWLGRRYGLASRHGSGEAGLLQAS